MTPPVFASPALPPGFEAHADAMVALADRIEGRVTRREMRLLALLGAAPTCAGTVLEIGSYRGRSTIILAKSAALAGDTRIHAVDPLSLPSETDPSALAAEDVAASFHQNLRNEGVEALVDFHQMRSTELAATWTLPLRLLWIDGDHTLDGARSDFRCFAPFLQPGAIVAFHDVLSRFPGPIRVVVEDVLSSNVFGACGFVGSIAWAQYLGDPSLTTRWRAHQKSLRARAAALIAQSDRGPATGLIDKWTYKLRRARIPHGEANSREVLGQLVTARGSR